jgi:hypothetical protein
MKLPKLTHLQFTVLTSLEGGDLEGKSVREEINWEQSRPAFYQLMSRLEGAGYASGKYNVESGKGIKPGEKEYITYYQMVPEN